ncbi:MAG: hypothetical protein OEZ01_05155 [Candidatus Heimdallarchaeota archaeon]|nr:hypothetical protein [Candidatus Heimdallarchaeota archaeon]MDH5645371.1 hypothetical protein [Candidatus Heimdallarchaeota archaeon]
MSRQRRRGVKELSVQRTSDFFKSANRRLAMVTILIRIIAIIMLALLVLSITNVLLDDVVSFGKLGIFFKFFILLFFVFVLALLTLVAYVAVPLSQGDESLHYFWASRSFIINNLFGSLNLLEGFDSELFFGFGQDPLAPMAYLLNKPQRELYKDDFLHGLITLGIILILITGVGFIRKSSVNLAGLTLLISQLVVLLAYMKDLTVELYINPTNVESLINSSMFRLALVSYLYFEFSLQTGYIYSLMTPTLTRQKRVGKQLASLSEFRLGITKLGTAEEKQISDEEKKLKEMREEDTEGKTQTGVSLGAGSTSAKKFSADALIFLLDSAQDSLFTKPGGEQERLTGRLQRYHDGLLLHDADLDNKLGGSAEKAFQPIRILFRVIGSMIFRVTILILFSWFVLNPARVTSFISLPEAISNSIEINEPEGLLLVLIPLIFFIISLSYFVAKLQTWVVKAEEVIIHESEIEKLLKAGKSITSRKDLELVDSILTGEPIVSTTTKSKQTNTATKKGAATRKGSPGKKPKPRRANKK